MDSGKWIRELREERFVKSSDIERISRSIAEAKGNPDFYVSHSTLADVETGSVPSIHKLFSLAAPGVRSFRFRLTHIVVNPFADLSTLSGLEKRTAIEMLRATF